MLLTGAPGVGKTTIVRQAVASFRGPAAGFYTEEVRQGGGRVGFDLVTLDGQRAPLARAGLSSPYRVGRYGVDITSLEGVGVPALRRAIGEGGLVVVDEIGKMELFAPGFRQVVAEALEAGNRILGTIMLGSHPWADGLKRDSRVQVLTLTRENRQGVTWRVAQWLEKVRTKVVQE